MRQHEINRREATRLLSLGSLLTLGLWPGMLTAKPSPQTGKFKFIVVNDTHYMTDECGAWLERVVTRMRAEEPDFCLLAGDLTEKGEKGHLGAVKEVFDTLRKPVHVVIGNHDYTGQSSAANYAAVFPNKLNYWFEHQGWQFVALDTTEGSQYEKTSVQPHTLSWLAANLPKLEAQKPTVVFTHFPMGGDVKYRPANADKVLEFFKPFNLQSVFCGHFHGYTERKFEKSPVYTNRCCALKRTNHDKTKEKGFFVCEADGNRLTTKFVEMATG